jgi:hypothetical protein
MWLGVQMEKTVIYGGEGAWTHVVSKTLATV